VSVDGPKRKCIIVPADQIIDVELSDSLAPKNTTNVRWGNLVLSMFTEDVLKRMVAFTDPTSIP
jgi:hypothetical protein